MKNLKFERIFITGDQHGCIDNILYLDSKEYISENDLIISLGDFGVPYWSASKKTKNDLDTFELFDKIHTNYAIIQGNHSKRFERVKWFRQEEFCGGNSFYCPKYPNFHFLQNGEVYDFNDMKFLAIGGGYSVDKYIRLERGWTWEPEEKLNNEEKLENAIPDNDYTMEVKQGFFSKLFNREPKKALPDPNRKVKTTGLSIDFIWKMRTLRADAMEWMENKPASYAIRYAAGFEDIVMVLSGMSNMEQMNDNIKSMKDFTPFTETEFETVYRVADIIRAIPTIPCTSCKYCTDGDRCPMNIRIHSLFGAENKARRFNTEDARGQYNWVTSKGGKPTDCIGCGACEEICPQQLPIRQLLKEIGERFEG